MPNASGASRRAWWAAAAIAAAGAVVTAGGNPGGPPASQPSAKPQAASQPSPGSVLTNALGMKFAYIPAGWFVMGSPAGEGGRHEDETQRRVRISHPFYLGVTEVTQAQWVAMGLANRSQTKADNLPVTKVSWPDAAAFCRKLSQKDGRLYRLPTEAQWEYACRAGAAGAFAGSGKTGEMAWHMDNSDDQPHAVGGKKPNAWGLYDMHGNVMEWCSDWYAPYVTAATTAPAEGKYRVARGGSYGHFARACRSAARASFNPAYQLDQLGLRVAMDIDPNEPRR